jgi:hypothetical protein
MWTSPGRYFSKASFSGALTEVCPATIEFILVANETEKSDLQISFDSKPIDRSSVVRGLTWTVLFDDGRDVFGFDRVDDKVRDPGDVVPVLHDSDSRLVCEVFVSLSLHILDMYPLMTYSTSLP